MAYIYPNQMINYSENDTNRYVKILIFVSCLIQEKKKHFDCYYFNKLQSFINRIFLHFFYQCSPS